MQDLLTLPELTLTIHHLDLPFYTTLLQSGIEIKSSSNESMGHFLNRLPGFTIDYVSDTVQTIFLNSTAVDDLTKPLGTNSPVLAISAAMPGLAGAIFRRNSFHAALRTSTDTTVFTKKESKPTVVTLKLFNSIALERGVELLEMGVCIRTLPLINLFTKKAALLKKIITIQLSSMPAKKENLISILTEIEKIQLKITMNYG